MNYGMPKINQSLYRQTINCIQCTFANRGMTLSVTGHC